MPRSGRERDIGIHPQRNEDHDAGKKCTYQNGLESYIENPWFSVKRFGGFGLDGLEHFVRNATLNASSLHFSFVKRHLILGWFYGWCSFLFEKERQSHPNLNSWWFGDVWGMVWGSREIPFRSPARTGTRLVRHWTKKTTFFGLRFYPETMDIFKNIWKITNDEQKRKTPPTSVNREPLASILLVTSLNREYLGVVFCECHFILSFIDLSGYRIQSQQQ